MNKEQIFPYSWHIDEDEENITSIRIYGLNKKNENVCLKVDNFTPYVYIELPSNINWTASKAQMVGNKIDQLMGEKRPIKKILVYKKKLYGVYLDLNGKRKKFPYLFCNFVTHKDSKIIRYKLNKGQVNIPGIGSIKLRVHESNANPILQLTCCRQISTAGWIEFHGKKEEPDNYLTLCDYEYKVKWKHLFNYESELVPLPKIMGFDIEVNSTIPSSMPNAERPGDKVFQISCILCREGDSEDKYESYLLTLGNPIQSLVGKDVNILRFKTETQLLEGFTAFIRKHNPNLIAGYNILGFDIPYMIERAKHNMCIYEFDQMGFHKFAHAKEKTIDWSSSAYKNQNFQFLDAEGRVFVDLLPLVKRDYKFSNYKLKTVAEHFVGQTKDPLSAKGIFKCYKIGTKKEKNGKYGKKARKAISVCGKYCVKDTVLVNLLMDKLKIWFGLTEMSKTTNVPIFSLFTQGQQIKVFSQVYKHCIKENIVVEQDVYEVKEDERYVGAHVFPPVPGKYKMVVPLDFSSLYPSTIIAYNIDYHSWIPDDCVVPKNRCLEFKWEDHVGCQHDPKVIKRMQLTKYIDDEMAIIKKLREKRDRTFDKVTKLEIKKEIKKRMEDLKPYRAQRADINKTKPKHPMCAKRHYRFLKDEKGVIPTILQNLLDARKHTRKVHMVNCKKEIKRLQSEEEEKDCDNSKLIEEQKTLLEVLNKRQLSYKVSCNSMYGAMGVRRGMLPFMPGAMCTTYMGRVNIGIVAKTIPEKYGGELIYGYCMAKVNSQEFLLVSYRRQHFQIAGNS